jgi:hypothetical protein
MAGPFIERADRVGTEPVTKVDKQIEPLHIPAKEFPEPGRLPQVAGEPVIKISGKCGLALRICYLRPQMGRDILRHRRSRGNLRLRHRQPGLITMPGS